MNISPYRRALSIRRSLREREAVFHRFGYNSKVALAFVIGRAIPLKGRILEIGTGKGRFLALLSRHAKRITTLDINPKEQQLAQIGLPMQRQRTIRFVVHNAERLPWRNSTFDSVLSVNTFHHLKDPLRVLQEMIRVVKPSGKIVLSDLSPRGLRIFERLHRCEGRSHPRPQHIFQCYWRRLLDHGLDVAYWKRCGQEVLVASRKLLST